MHENKVLHTWIKNNIYFISTHMSLDECAWSGLRILNGVVRIVNVLEENLMLVGDCNNLILDFGWLADEHRCSQVLDDKAMSEVDGSRDTETQDRCGDRLDCLPHDLKSLLAISLGSSLGGLDSNASSSGGVTVNGGHGSKRFMCTSNAVICTL